MAVSSYQDQYDSKQVEINELADSLQALLDSYSQGAEQGIESAREQAEKLLKKTKASLGQRQCSFKKNLCASGCEVDGWIRDNPAAAVGASAALGLVFGLLLSRR